MYAYEVFALSFITRLYRAGHEEVTRFTSMMRAAGWSGERERCTRTSYWDRLQYYGTEQRSDFSSTWTQPVPFHIIKMQYTYASLVML
jgi:hypothetical protein